MIRWSYTVAGKIKARDIVDWGDEPREVVDTHGYSDGSLTIRVYNGYGGTEIRAFMDSTPIKIKVADCSPCYDSDCDCVFDMVG